MSNIPIREKGVMTGSLHAQAGTKLIVVIDHKLGGGANSYNSLVAKGLNENGFTILHLSYNFHTKTFKLVYKGLIYCREFTLEISSADWIKDLLLSLEPDYILVNELVSWQDPLNLIKILIELNTPYTTFVHDFFYICPSWNLINNEEKFCDIPEDMERCKKCLDHNKFADYITYYENTYPDIISWRRDMHSFLQRARQMVCFSESSKSLFLKTYGDLSNIVVVEHTIEGKESFIWKQREFKGKTPLTVGVIGNIGFHKGEKIIKNLLEHPVYNELPVNIAIIGCEPGFPAYYKSDDERLIVHGAYRREELSRLIAGYNVSVVLIPSICPETFSFTTSEALLLGYPVICFDIGAPAERVRKYNAGIVVNDISAEGLLNAFKKILDKPYLIKELSANTRRYVPPTSQEHSAKILSILESTASLSKSL